jgi:hypothetical protein
MNTQSTEPTAPHELTAEATVQPARPTRWRRFREWVWRSQRLEQLKPQRRSTPERLAVEDAKSCLVLAQRTLAGIEPLPARSRDAVARPLIVTGIRKCLPLLRPPPGAIGDLFSDATWQEQLVLGGVPSGEQPAVRAWLDDESSATNASTSQYALQTLVALIESLDHADSAVRRLYWHRVRVLAGSFALLAGLVALLLFLVAPPEGPDLAAGKRWEASSAYPGYTASGVKPAKATEPALFCTNEDNEPWWSLDLGAASSIGSVTIVNRADCCIERAPPLVVEVSPDGKKWREVARTTEAFRTWRPSFKPAKARYVRLRSLRRTYLHMKDVRVHPAR